MSVDDLRGMSDELAADPQSLVFLRLGEALLSRGDLSSAARVAERGAARHSERTEGHDLVARIALARDDEERAAEAWEAVLSIDANHANAHRGIGLLCYRHGDFAGAERHLEAALSIEPNDDSVIAALKTVRYALQSVGAEAEPQIQAQSTGVDQSAGSGQLAESGQSTEPEQAVSNAHSVVDPTLLFDEILEDSAQVALLLDADGLVTAGEYQTADGTDLGIVIGAHLSGVSDEASRAMRHLGLGDWKRVVLESEAAVVAMAPAGESVVLVASPVGTPLGFARRTLDRCLDAARGWLGGEG